MDEDHNIHTAEKWSLIQFFTRSVIHLENLAQTDVGQSESSALCISWDILSPRHAAFVVNAYGNLLLRDLNSNSGTFVNGKPLPTCENRLLAHGDIVSFGLSHYKDVTSNVMKMCFFGVVADDRKSTMGILVPAKVRDTANLKITKVADPVDSADKIQPSESECSTSIKGKKVIENIQSIKIPDKTELADSKSTNSSIKIPQDVVLSSGLQKDCFDDSSSDSWIHGLIESIDKDTDKLPPFQMLQESADKIYMTKVFEYFDDISKPSTSQMTQTISLNDFDDIDKPSTSHMTQTIYMQDFDDINKPSTSQTPKSISMKVSDDINKPSTSQMTQTISLNDFEDLNKPSTSQMTQTISLNNSDDIKKPSTSKVQASKKIVAIKKESSISKAKKSFKG